MKKFDLVVIGGGSAGLVVAAGAAHIGARVALIEKRALGGDCLFTGCVPSKTLLRSARFAADVKRAETFGFAPLTWHFKDDDFKAITKRVARIIATVGERDAPERFERFGVELIFGTPRFISPHTLEINLAKQRNQRDAKLSGEKILIEARRFCLAIGSRPKLPLIEGLAGAGVITNEEIFQLEELPATLIVIGGGAIGVELGQAFARFGSRVTIIEQGARLLPKEDEEASLAIEGVLREEGLEILLNTKPVRASRDGVKRTLVVENYHGAQNELQAEAILVATGRAPNIEGLNLEAAGVAYDSRCVTTDDYLRTTARHIYAAGDITGHFPFTHMAAHEAATVVRNVFFFRPFLKRADFSVVPWATYTEPEVAHVGVTEREARERFGANKIRIYRTAFDDNDRAHAEEMTIGFAKIICVGSKEKIVGAHIVGAHAGELIHEIVLAMKQGLSVRALGNLIHVYPTLTQVNQQAGLDAVLAQLASPVLKKILARYFAWWRV